MTAFLYALAGVFAFAALIVVGAARTSSRGSRAAEQRDKHRETR